MDGRNGRKDGPINRWTDQRTDEHCLLRGYICRARLNEVERPESPAVTQLFQLHRKNKLSYELTSSLIRLLILIETITKSITYELDYLRTRLLTDMT